LLDSYLKIRNKTVPVKAAININPIFMI